MRVSLKSYDAFHPKDFGSFTVVRESKREQDFVSCVCEYIRYLFEFVWMDGKWMKRRKKRIDLLRSYCMRSMSLLSFILCHQSKKKRIWNIPNKQLNNLCQLVYKSEHGEYSQTNTEIFTWNARDSKNKKYWNAESKANWQSMNGE